MKRLLLLTPLMLMGCAHYTTTQHDYSYEGTNGVPVRKITTHVAATTFFDASSALTKFSASQTDKTQNTRVGSLEQSATATNVVTIVGDATALGKLFIPH